MAALTIAQRRALQLEKFNDEYIHDIEKARKILNSYYRYHALYTRVLVMDNDSNYYGSRYHQEQSKKEEKWRNRLTEMLKPYGISIYVSWSMPFLGIVNPENGCIEKEVINPILYN